MRLKTSVIGLGPAGRGFHLGAWAFLEDTVPTCAYDPDPSTADLPHMTRKKCRHYTDLSLMLETEEIDVISICSPPQFHLRDARLALESGIRFLVIEKPLVMNEAELDELRSFEKKYDAKICPIHNFKYQPGIQSIYDSHAAGKLGRVLHVERTWLKNGEVDRMVIDPEHWCKDLPAGRWGETMPHDLYTAIPFLGNLTVLNVDARQTHQKWPWLGADEVSVLLKGSATQGTLLIRYSANQGDNLFKHMTVHGSKAIAYTDGMRATEAVWPYGFDRDPEFTQAEKYVSGHYPLMRQAIDFFTGKSDTRPISWDEASQVVRLTTEIGNEIDRLVPRKTN